MSIFSRGNLKTAFTSLRNAKWRSFLTMLGIIIGIVSVVTIVGIYSSVTSFLHSCQGVFVVILDTFVLYCW